MSIVEQQVVGSVVKAVGFWPWTVATIGARLPIAMAPLALVLAGEQASGSYAFGGLLVAAHTVGEVVGSPVMGRLSDRWRSPWVLTSLLVLQGVGFVLVARLLADDSSQVAVAALTAGVGGVAAGVPGSLRARLTQIVADGSVSRALSLDNLINQLAWTVAPVVIAFLTVVLGGPAVLALVAVPALVSAGACGLLPASTVCERELSSPMRVLLVRLGSSLWLTGVLRLSLGVLAVAATPMTSAAGHAVLAGVALGVYAVAAGVSGVVLAPWIGGRTSYVTHAALWLVGLGTVLVLALVAGQVIVGILVLFAVAGFAEGPVTICLALHIQRTVAPTQRGTAYSMQYAVLGVGFALGSLMSGLLLHVTSGDRAVAIVGILIVLLAAPGLWGPVRHTRSRPPSREQAERA